MGVWGPDRDFRIRSSCGGTEVAFSFNETHVYLQLPTVFLNRRVVADVMPLAPVVVGEHKWRRMRASRQ